MSRLAPPLHLQRRAGALLLAAAFAFAGCESDDSSPSGTGAVNLGIPDRAWDPGHDDVGWCGETCIQMAVAHFGREIPQAEINRAAGSPPDITEDNMDAALRNLGVPYASWNEANSDVNAFIAWIQSWLDRGCPVICGPSPSLDDTCGQAALRAKSDDPDEWASLLSDLIADPVARQRCVDQGLSHAKGFSWSDTARRTLEVYRQAAGQ